VTGNANIFLLQGSVLGIGATAPNLQVSGKLTITGTAGAINVDIAHIIGNPTVINEAPNTGSLGTIINPIGNLNISNIFVNAPGDTIAFLAAGDITGSGFANINLSSSTGHGGSLTMIAGYNFAAAAPITVLPDTTTLIQIAGPSATGGNINLGKIGINTSSTAPSTATNTFAGDILLVAAAGSVSAGTITVGAINATSANGNGGNVEIIGQGGVQINGSINTSAKLTGGTVSLAGAPAGLLNTVGIFDGFVVGGTIEPGATVPGAGATVSVTGAITTKGSTVAGGSVFLQADRQVTVSGAIITSGLQAFPGLTAGGAFFAQSLNANVQLAAVTTSALNVPADTLLPGGFAGNIVISGGNGITTGTLSAVGASNAGGGNAGGGGNVTLLTGTTVINNQFIPSGTIKVTGFINTSGGSGSATAGGSAGSGGNVSVQAASFAVTGSTGGASILAKAGKPGLNGFNNAGGLIQISTFAIQTLPSSLDFTSTARNIAAVPGGMFSLGAGGPI
jgi:filamentous hemagglutinin